MLLLVQHVGQHTIYSGLNDLHHTVVFLLLLVGTLLTYDLPVSMALHVITTRLAGLDYNVTSLILPGQPGGVVTKSKN